MSQSQSQQLQDELLTKLDDILTQIDKRLSTLEFRVTELVKAFNNQANQKPHSETPRPQT